MLLLIRNKYGGCLVATWVDSVQTENSPTFETNSRRTDYLKVVCDRKQNYNLILGEFKNYYIYL